jgi:hypothetical protein
MRGNGLARRADLNVLRPDGKLSLWRPLYRELSRLHNGVSASTA